YLLQTIVRTFGTTFFMRITFMDTLNSIYGLMIIYRILARVTVFCFYFLLSVSCISSSNAQNIAKGKKYQFSVDCDYSLTKGSDDTDLTDGVKKGATRFWHDKTTVGWSYKDEIRIDLDLGGSYSINRILINTARGEEAGVEFPSHCLVFTSWDNEHFEFQGDLMLSELNVPGSYKVKSFELAGLSANGRYLKLVLIPNGKFLFLDEIEVYGKQKHFTKLDVQHLIRRKDLNYFVKKAVKNSSDMRNERLVAKTAGDFLALSDNTAKRKFGSHEEIEKTVREVLQEQFPQKVIFTPIYSTKELSDFNINVIKQRLGTDYELDVCI